MADLPKKAVVDASVIIAHLNDDEVHHQVCTELLQDAEDGNIELWAPNIILVEVNRWTRDTDPTDAGAREKLRDFLGQPWLHTMEVTEKMIDIAHDVLANTTVKTGIDALYVATAHLRGMKVVYAVDDKVEKAQFGDVEGRRPPGATAPRLPYPAGVAVPRAASVAGKADVAARTAVAGDEIPPPDGDVEDVPTDERLDEVPTPEEQLTADDEA